MVWLGLIQLIGCVIGSMFAFFLPDKTPFNAQKTFYGFIGGFFASAMFWSLVSNRYLRRIAYEGLSFFIPILICFLAGFFLMPTLSSIFRRFNIAKGKKSYKLAKTAKFLVAVALYQLAKGLIVGVASVDESWWGIGERLADKFSTQNIVLSACFVTPLIFSGISRGKAILLAVLTDVAAVIATPSVLFLQRFAIFALPFFIFFAGGSMFWLIMETLLSKKTWLKYFSISGLVAAYVAGILGVGFLVYSF